MAEKQTNRSDDLQSDIDARLAAQRKTINVAQEKRTSSERLSTVMTWIMILILLGTLIFSAMAATGLIG